MHGSNWRGYDQAFIGLLACFVAVLLAVAIWKSATLSEFYRHSAEQTSKSYGYAAEENISRSCTGRDFAATAKCIKEIVEATHEAQTAQNHLTAQRDMALWAFAMFWIGVVSIALTSVGIFFVKQTLDANRAIVETAAEANRNARELGEAQVRAYLTFQDVHIDFDWYLPRIRFKIYNAGNSPATKIIASGACYRKAADTSEDSVVFAAATGIGTLRAGSETGLLTIYIGQPIHEVISAVHPVPRSLISAMLRVHFFDVFNRPQDLNADFVGLVEGSHRDMKQIAVAEEVSFGQLRVGPAYPQRT